MFYSGFYPVSFGLLLSKGPQFIYNKLTTTSQLAHMAILVCWDFMSWQHQRSYRDDSQLVIVHTLRDCIVSPPLEHCSFGTMI